MIASFGPGNFGRDVWSFRRNGGAYPDNSARDAMEIYEKIIRSTRSSTILYWVTSRIDILRSLIGYPAEIPNVDLRRPMFRGSPRAQLIVLGR